MSELGDRIVACARTWIGTPYFHAGRSRHGLDCLGLLAVVAHEVGITQEDGVDYAPDPPAERLTATLTRFARPLGVPATVPGPLLPGDLLQFDIVGVPRHAGIYAADERGRPTMIHAYQGAGRVVEHLFDRHWQRRLWAAYRLEERPWRR